MSGVVVILVENRVPTYLFIFGAFPPLSQDKIHMDVSMLKRVKIKNKGIGGEEK